tara:strand:- start:857 stop:1045 length:189 start_codon:yes stop_codon:yes gene_type:complete
MLRYCNENSKENEEPKSEQDGGFAVFGDSKTFAIILHMVSKHTIIDDEVVESLTRFAETCGC